MCKEKYILDGQTKIDGWEEQLNKEKESKEENDEEPEQH